MLRGLKLSTLGLALVVVSITLFGGGLSHSPFWPAGQTPGAGSVLAFLVVMAGVMMVPAGLLWAAVSLVSSFLRRLAG